MDKHYTYALVAWGRPRKHGAPPTLRFARVLGIVTVDGKVTAYNCQTKPGPPDHDRIPFSKTIRTFGLAEIAHGWRTRPRPAEIRRVLDERAREEQIEASRMYADIIHRIKDGHAG